MGLMFLDEDVFWAKKKNKWEIFMDAFDATFRRYWQCIGFTMGTLVK